MVAQIKKQRFLKTRIRRTIVERIIIRYHDGFKGQGRTFGSIPDGA